jgi:hypothetical protein
MDNFTPSILPRDFQKGDRGLDGNKLRQITSALRKMTGGIKPTKQVFTPRPPLPIDSAYPFLITTIQQNYLECTDINGNGSYNVAKPTLLQAEALPLAPDRDVIGPTGSVAFTVSYSSPSTDGQEITATKSTDSSTEKDVVGPAYQVGDTIWAINVTAGFNDLDDNPILWLDINIDGRAWQAVP